MIALWIFAPLAAAMSATPHAAEPMRSLSMSPGGAAAQSGPAEIRRVVAAMEVAWNRGDFRGYMVGFANPGVTFVSRGQIQNGWQGTLDHYIRDYGGAPERRGTVHFYDLTIDMLGPDAAMLVGRYRLDRPAEPQQGINTRLFRRIGGRWVITMNHVSSFEPSAPAGQ